MAVIKAVNSKSSLKNVMQYVKNREKTDDKLISGKDCSPESALEEMQVTKEQFRKTTGRQYKHFIQSFNPNDNIDYQKAHKIGLEWAEKNFKGYEVLIATHKDKEHIHNHFIVNSVSFENGKKYRQSKKDLIKLKENSDKLCEREGLSVIKSKSKDITLYNQNKYQLFKRIEQNENVKSYVLNTYLAVDKSVQGAASREDFIKKMNNLGYQVKWSDTNKNITFKDQEENKVRLSNLEKTFKDSRLSKEGLENEFTITKGKSREPGYTGGTIDKASGTEHESENGIREHSTERELGTIEGRIREVEQGVKGNTPDSQSEHNRTQDIQRNAESEHEKPNREYKDKIRERDFELDR